MPCFPQCRQIYWANLASQVAEIERHPPEMNRKIDLNQTSCFDSLLVAWSLGMKKNKMFITPKLAVTLPSITFPSHHSTLQWHPAMAPRPFPQRLVVTLLQHDGTQQWQHHCTLQWHPGATSNPPKWFVAPPFGSKNSYSFRYLGKKNRELFLCFRQPTQSAQELIRPEKWFELLLERGGAQNREQSGCKIWRLKLYWPLLINPCIPLSNRIYNQSKRQCMMYRCWIYDVAWKQWSTWKNENLRICHSWFASSKSAACFILFVILLRPVKPNMTKYQNRIISRFLLKGIAMPIFAVCFPRRAGWSTRCSRRSTDTCCLSCVYQNL